MATSSIRAASIAFSLAVAAGSGAQSSFVNWESPHVHPIDRTPDGSTLLLVNTADNRLEIFDLSGALPSPTISIPVGLDPVTVRVRSNTEAWVVNHISDSISIVSLVTMNVVETITVGDEPCDVVFAGAPERAFVSVSQENRIAVLDPSNLAATPGSISIEGEDPRAMATDGTTVYAAIFESGNNTTIVAQPDVSSGFNPYGVGVNPPPNADASFSPPIKPQLPTPPEVGLIVKKDDMGAWRDDNETRVPRANWSPAVGWDLHDHDLAMIDANTQTVTYATGLMNLLMGLALRADGRVTVIGTDAINHVRFEPNVNGVFVRVMLASVDPLAPGATAVADLNPHLDYTISSVPIVERLDSLGDPRAIVWNAGGTKGYVAGMGSDNIAVIDASGARLGRIDVAQGPTGLVLDEPSATLYVLNRFDGLLTVIDTTNDSVALEIPFFDPTPDEIKLGRPFLYNTQQFSGLGQVSCGSCHIDGRMDQLAWDLGAPNGDVKVFNQSCLFPGNLIGCEDWHPMKGPMTTQTLIGIIGTEPFHWRADREDLPAFNPAFVSLLGGDTQITEPEMQLFNDFVATLTYPPNPFRAMDGSLTSDPIEGGDPVSGQNLFLNVTLDGGTCNDCHTAPTGTNGTLTPAILLQETQSIKVPQLRNMHEKTGFDQTSQTNNRGFAYIKDGTVDTLFNFLLFPAFSFSNGPPGNQERRDVAAFLFAFSTDTHAGVGTQTTLIDEFSANMDQLNLIQDMIALAESGAVGLVVKGVMNDAQRGYAYAGADLFQSDRLNETIDSALLRSLASPGGELTYTLVPKGSETRIGVDRDGDGSFDSDETDIGSDPADPDITPDDFVPLCDGDANVDGEVSFDDVTSVLANWLKDYTGFPSQSGPGDANGDGLVNFDDINSVLSNWLSVCP